MLRIINTLRAKERRIAAAAAVVAVILTLLIGMLPAGTALAQAPQRITFTPGATSANVDGYITGQLPKAYVLRAMAGQRMTIDATFMNYSYSVSITAPNGAPLGMGYAGGSWSSYLPASGDYQIVVSAPPGMGATRIYYKLDVEVVGSVAPPTPQPGGAERINFAPGAVSATVNGTVNAAAPKRYVLRAMAGQQMTVQTNSSGPFQVTVSGANGQGLGSTNANQDLTVYLPTTQDYYITLTAPADAPTASYSLRVTVVGGSPTPTPTSVGPCPPTQRINFAPGAVSATVSGVASSACDTVYVLRAMGGQNMTVQASGSGSYRVAVTGADGSALATVNSGQSASVSLPRTQDYYLAVRASVGAPSPYFTLVITITGSSPTPTTQTIRFAPGATSATVNGNAPARFKLTARADQTMYVQLYTSSSPVNATITGANSSYLGAASNSTPWSGRLAYNGDYYIAVSSPDVGAYFTMVVTIY